MKRILLIFVGVFLYSNHGFAYPDCSRVDKAVLEKYDYNVFQENNSHRQISGDAFRSLDEQGKREAKLRNLCFGASVLWHYWCGWSFCEDCEGEGRKKKCRSVEQNETVLVGSSLTYGDYCTWAEMDCFTEDIDKIYEVLRKETDYATKLFMDAMDMNRLVKSILDGTENIYAIDAEKSVCYRTDDNGDTVWHAFARSHRDAFDWEELCASVIKDGDPFDFLSFALYKTKNNNGKTAVQEAIDSGTPDSIFGFFWMYARQERPFEWSDGFIARDIAQTNNLDLATVKKLMRCPE